MKGVGQFDEFIKIGIVKKQSPDKSRSKFLVMEAKQGYSYLLKLIKTMGIENQSMPMLGIAKKPAFCHPRRGHETFFLNAQLNYIKMILK